MALCILCIRFAENQDFKLKPAVLCCAVQACSAVLLQSVTECLFKLEYKSKACCAVQARSAGAKAFRILCIRCTSQLSHPAALSGLITSAHAATSAGTSLTSGQPCCTLHLQTLAYDACLS